jgi:hypothetical protein
MAAIRLAVPGRGTKLCYAPFGVAAAPGAAESGGRR